MTLRSRFTRRVISRGSGDLKSLKRARVRAIGLATTAALAALVVSASPAVAEPSKHPFEIVPSSFRVTPSTLQAGAHANLTTSFDFAHNSANRTFNDVRSTIVNLPPGFIGSNTAVPTCSVAQLLTPAPPKEDQQVVEGTGAACPPDSQVGTISFMLSNNGEPVYQTFDLYNMEVNTPGIAAELGFHAIVITQLLTIALRPGDSGLTVTSPSILEYGEPHNVSVTVWGVPNSSAHDAERGLECNTFVGALACFGGGEKVGSVSPKPFLTNPTSCGSFHATMTSNSWEEPEHWSEASTEVGPIAECERVPFEPSIEVNPTTRSAESSSGLEASEIVPQTWEKPESISTANVEGTTLTLPVGYTINPSAGSGLVGCTPQELEAASASSLPGEGCPQESKIGSLEVETPVLAEKLGGAIYVAQPYDNPFHSLLALYIVVKDFERGIVVKLAGHVELNPVTGQLVTTFDGTPQVPFDRFTLKLHQGVTSPLVSPPTCGTYTATAELTPWSALSAPVFSEGQFLIEDGIGGGVCPPGGVPPFSPKLLSGTQQNSAGAYSPFYLRLTREDGEQELAKFTTVMPPGLTGNLTGIPFCPEADIEAARAVTGTEELEHPSCPAASQIGHTIVEAGVGTVLAQTPGKMYLAGPYHGAPLSVVSVTAAKVGPFDLGTVVVRFALDINPITAQVEINGSTSDPIPHIIQGIVVHVRDIRAYVDRERFIENPTSCEHLQVTDTVYGVNPENLSQITPVGASSPFQAANCQNLAFKPTFSALTSSKVSRTLGTSLTVKLGYPKAPQGTQANIHLVKVELPKQLPSRLSTLQKACTEAAFDADPATCPATSIIGHAKAITPILPEPLEGPAYFVSHGGAAWPELIMVLQGYGFTIDLHGETLISKQGVTSSTFHAIPDEPVTSFELTLPSGPYSALTGLGNLCKETLTMPTQFIAQNGMELRQRTKVAVTGCPKAKKSTHKKKRKRGKHKKR
jgi:hypothetical protein